MTVSMPMALSTRGVEELPAQWQAATWEEYVALREAPTEAQLQLTFDAGDLLIHDMGNEGINHAKVSDLFTLLIGLWFMRHAQQTAESLGRCVLENQPLGKAAAPDLVVYVGDGVPEWQEGDPRRIDLTRCRVPDLVGEISDTTLATDLDEKKRLYAALGISEYWVIDVRGKRILAFRLQDNGKYRQCQTSVALLGLPIALLAQTLIALNQGTNITAAQWFSQQIAALN